MKTVVTQTLYQYWNDLRGARPAPNRSEIDPGQIRSLLGDTFILELIDPHTVRYRLAGTRLCSTHCRELKGRNFLRGWGEKDKEALASLITAVTEDAAAAVVGINGHTEHDHILPMEMVLLPLNVPGEGHVRVLGCCATMERPYWIGMHPIMRQSIASMRLIWPDERPHFLNDAQKLNPVLPRFTAQTTMAMPAGALQAQGAIPSGAQRRVGHLVVYQGGKS